ncbi:hypothetical protein [Bradymonas sediminis]|uniref:Uncharacterized protein n=1 Tax=Bradymonas sediminis TaxID=1548548 RepID=A0A2Z4FLP7_9DELT|nr:hypothetical protein [Bradymonas sediminis]AWV89893.1 hypothetical protein DN745_11305 [Bradymonas sediminis]TDP61994.1 hypothetical protein DFR33_11510 [Bradymonas sediminis]
MNSKYGINPRGAQEHRIEARRGARQMTWVRRGLATAATLLLVGAAAGCASGGSQGNGGGLMGLDSQSAQAIWADWTPVARGDQGLLPDAFVDEVVAFDYWQIDAAEFEEDAWSGAASVLDYLRREASDGSGLNAKQRATATLLLQALDGGAGEANAIGARRMDVTFVVSLDPDRAEEGMIVRFYAPLTDKGATPGLAIYMGRVEGESGGFERALVWARPGFEQAEAFTVALNQAPASADADGWSARQYDGIVAPRDSANGEMTQGDSLEEVAGLAEAIFKSQFWTPFSGSNYVEAKSVADQERALPDDIKPALGLTLRERQIEEIYRDTVFIPRDDIDLPAEFL